MGDSLPRDQEGALWQLMWLSRLKCRGELYERDVNYDLMVGLVREVMAWAACAEWEKFLLGEVSAHTSGKLADCGRRANEVVAAARARYEAREEERRRREEEWRERRSREP